MGATRSTVCSLWKFLCLFVVLYLAACVLLVPHIEQGDSIPSSYTADDQDDPSRVLADFYSSSNKGDNGFFFGLANSACQVEDRLNDSWIDLARGESGKVRAWKNAALAEERLRFWSEPDVDLQLAAEAGATVFRLSIDWGRIVISEPVRGSDAQVDWKAVKHYQHILRRVHEHGMKVMLTLFHFALPKWANAYGGWTDARTVFYFADFTMLVKEQLGQYVDYWVTFNEPNIYGIFTHCTRSFPSTHQESSLLSFALCLAPFGAYHNAMEQITKAHVIAYTILHEEGSTNPKPVGVAQFAAVVRPYGLVETPGAVLLRHVLSYLWIDRILHHLDFCGINFYGMEVGSMIGLIIDNDASEYSEAGRGLFPNGLFEVLTAFHKRYGSQRPSLRYIVTENGIADSSDRLRRPFLLEHLLAVSAARAQGVPVDGYIYWTISDNWEWIDGYCPRFGLVAVDRNNNLTRTPRSSFYLFQQVAQTGIITTQQRSVEWDKLQIMRTKGMKRPFCRSYDGLGRAGIESRDVPFMRALSKRDWRFGSESSLGCKAYAKRTCQLIWSLIHNTPQGFSTSLSIDNVTIIDEKL